MRRGTFARVCCIDKAIAIFVSPTPEEPPRQRRQVVILGSGKDTTYLRYRADLLTTPTRTVPNHSSSDAVDIHWYEVDLPSVIEAKERLVNTLPQNLMAATHDTRSSCWLPTVLETKESSANTLQRNLVAAPHNKTRSHCRYHLVPFDLRSNPNDLFKLLTSNEAYNFNLNAPTIFVLECVFMYLSEDSSRRLLSAISDLCELPLVVIYDPILQISKNESSPFGRMMHQHLKRAGVLPRERPSSIETCVSVSLYQEKLFNCGFDVVVGCNMADAYESIVTENQRNHASSIEMLDELEEWTLLMSHYCFITSTTSTAQRHPLFRTFCHVSDDDSVVSNPTASLDEPLSSMGFIKGKCIRRLQYSKN